MSLDPEVEALVAKLAREVAQLRKRLDAEESLPTLERQHRKFVARLREREEE